jgi:hypothetical protein
LRTYTKTIIIIIITMSRALLVVAIVAALCVGAFAKPPAAISGSGTKAKSIDGLTKTPIIEGGGGEAGTVPVETDPCCDQNAVDCEESWGGSGMEAWLAYSNSFCGPAAEERDVAGGVQFCTKPTPTHFVMTKGQTITIQSDSTGYTFSYFTVVFHATPGQTAVVSLRQVNGNGVGQTIAKAKASGLRLAEIDATVPGAQITCDSASCIVAAVFFDADKIQGFRQGSVYANMNNNVFSSVPSIQTIDEYGKPTC